MCIFVIEFACWFGRFVLVKILRLNLSYFAFKSKLALSSWWYWKHLKNLAFLAVNLEQFQTDSYQCIVHRQSRIDLLDVVVILFLYYFNIFVLNRFYFTFTDALCHGCDTISFAEFHITLFWSNDW